jgi:hypothetical protein
VMNDYVGNSIDLKCVDLRISISQRKETRDGCLYLHVERSSPPVTPPKKSNEVTNSPTQTHVALFREYRGI